MRKRRPAVNVLLLATLICFACPVSAQLSGHNSRGDYGLQSGDVWDAFIGFKGNISLGDRWFIPSYADVGTGDSDFTWQATAGIAYKAADWADIALVYRYLAWDLGGDVIDDLDFSGPRDPCCLFWRTVAAATVTVAEHGSTRCNSSVTGTGSKLR